MTGEDLTRTVTEYYPYGPEVLNKQDNVFVRNTRVRVLTKFMVSKSFEAEDSTLRFSKVRKNGFTYLLG